MKTAALHVIMNGIPGISYSFLAGQFSNKHEAWQDQEALTLCCGGCTYESILEFSLRSVNLRLPQSPFPEVWSRDAVALSLSLLVRAGIFSYSRAERRRPRPSRSLTHLSQTGKLKKPGSWVLGPRKCFQVNAKYQPTP